MKQINYKQLKNIANLPSYDIGTKPIGSGFQGNNDLILIGYTTQQAAPITNNFVPEAKALAILFGASKVLPLALSAGTYITTYNSALLTATNEAFNKVAASGMDMLSEGAKEGVKAAAKSSAKSAASKALGAANVAMNAYSAVKGTVDTLKNWSDSSTLTAGDLYNSAQQNTEYVNGVAYNTMGGIDDKGFNDYVSAQNKANKIGGAMSGAEAGMGIGGLVGSIFTPLGSLIGSGIGGLVGGLIGAWGGHRARERRRRLMEEAKHNYMLAANAQNTQNYSDAMTQSMQNDYYATHADKGITKCDNGVALVNDREVTGNAYKDESGNLRIADAHTVSSPYGRADVKLENVKADSGFVIGHKKDKDGIELNEKARVYERMFNSGIPQLRNIGEQGLLLLLNVQPHIKDNNPKPQYAKDIEKAANGMPMADKGLPLYDGGNGGTTPKYYDSEAYKNWLRTWLKGRTPIIGLNAIDTIGASAKQQDYYNIDAPESYRQTHTFADYVGANQVARQTKALNNVTESYEPNSTDPAAKMGAVGAYYPGTQQIKYYKPWSLINSTPIHEMTHALKGGTWKTPNDKNVLYSLKETPQVAKIRQIIEQKYPNGSFLVDPSLYDPKYSDDPEEMYSRQNQGRYITGMQPEFKITQEDISDIINNGMLDPYKQLDRIKINPNIDYNRALNDSSYKSPSMELVLSDYTNRYTKTQRAVDRMPLVPPIDIDIDDPKWFNRYKPEFLEELHNEVGAVNNDMNSDLYMADKGKSINNMKTRKYLSYLPMFDDGMDGAQYPLMSYLGNYLANKAMQKEVRNSKIHAFNPYTPSNGEYAVNMMPTQYDITPQKYALYGALRHGLYNVDQDGTASAGMRSARKNNLFNNYMRGIAGLMSEKFNKENEMMSNKAKLMYQALSDEANRRYQGNAQYYDQLAKGYGQRNNQLMALKATMPKDFDRLMQNLSNIRYQNKYLDMVSHSNTNDEKKIIADLINKFR